MANGLLNIGIIGAGSMQFTLDLIRDLCLTEGLHGSTVWLIGHVDREKIDLVHNVGSRHSEEMSAGLRMKTEWESFATGKW